MKPKSIISLSLLLGLGTFSTVKAKSYTNFVVILMDDMGYGDTKSNGAIGYETPNIEMMQREGMTFTRYYAP